MSDRDLAALVALLDDPEAHHAEVLVGRLESDPTLRDRTWQIALQRLAASDRQPPEALAQVILRHDAEPLVDAVEAAATLEDAVWLLARLYLPRHDHAAAGCAALDALASRLAAVADGRELAKALGDDFGFVGDSRHFSDPMASYLPWVLEHRSGLPIALTALWMLLGRRLGLVCEAVALPGHVVGRWRTADGRVGYVDPFTGGADLDRSALDRLCQSAGGGGAGVYLAAASDRALIRRMARNLVLAYLHRNDPVRATIAHAVAAG
jgi:regulator of sirC expression with transglutaminase-like and TPR domain